jgi:hypothetical protein
MTPAENPFPREAVVTYGRSIRYSARLRSMNVLHDELASYLSNYEAEPRRYGTAIGICGEHGSGKTHVLNWLASRGREIRHSNCDITYVKVDFPQILDIYQQVMRELTRPRIIDLLQRSLVTIAREEARAAKVTEIIDRRLDNVASLNELIEEGSLDRTRMENLLESRLGASAPSDLVRTLIDCAGPSGDAAYHWLRADEVTGTAPLGLVHKFTSGAPDADDTMALHGLTLIAALYDLADVPFVLMVDQLEVMLSAEGPRLKTLSSLAKRSFEALSAASALVFIAGTDDGWSRVTRDVFPRLRLGAPQRVGGLDLEQTAKLIAAYTEDSTEYADATLERLFAVGGGSPREVLRISHLAWAQHAGRLDDVTPSEILTLAHESSTIADRARLALEMIDQTVRGRFEANEIRFKDAGTVDRLVRAGSTPTAAILLLRAADRTEEAKAARELRAVSERLHREWPQVRVVAVTVGYTSRQVNELLESAVTVIEFNEETFRSRIETELTLAITQQKAADQGAPEVAKALDQIAKRLERIESSRETTEEGAGRRFAAAVEEQARADTARAELRTRVEILEHLNLLDKVCRENDLDKERGLMRALLVSNEVHRKDVVFDQLGAVYLEFIAVAGRPRPGAPAGPDIELQDERLNLLATMKAHLSSPAMPPLLIEHPVRTAVYGGLATVVIASLLMAASGYASGRDLSFTLMSTLPFSLGCGIAVALTWYFLVIVCNPTRRAAARLQRIRAERDRTSVDSSGAGASTILGFIATAAVLTTGLVYVRLMSVHVINVSRYGYAGPAAMIVSALLIATNWRMRPWRSAATATRVSAALITIAGMSAILTFASPGVFYSYQVEPTDTAASDTSYTSISTDTSFTSMSTDTSFPPMSSTDTSSTNFSTTDTSATSTSSTETSSNETTSTSGTSSATST